MIIGSKVITSEADIEKSKVIICEHAIERFVDHLKERSLPLPKSYRQAKEMLAKLFVYSCHKNATDPVHKVKALIDHGETFFFRNGNWLFPVAGTKGKNAKHLILITAIWNRRLR